jgi:uroporphyrinogen III methyltransferase/synthase
MTVVTDAGLVTFVGTGPGDPGLLTLRAAEKLGKADTVVVNLGTCPSGFLAHCRADAAIVDADERDAGKLVLAAAKTGARVVRLVAGDSGLGSKAALEAGFCVAAGVPFEILPGVSAVTAVPQYAGIPLTDEKVREVRVIDATGGGVDWDAYSSDRATLVILGAEGNVSEVAKGLMAAGRPDSTPAATVSTPTPRAWRRPR